VTAPQEPRGLRRRADKLRFVAWANLFMCVAVGLYLDFGDAALKWSAAALWSLLLFGVCHLLAGRMDQSGPVKRRQGG
jgi:hypothetical protein